MAKTFSHRVVFLSWLTLALSIFSIQGVGFFVHVAELADADENICIGDCPIEHGVRLTIPAGGPAASAVIQTASGHHSHDCATCTICRQFLNSNKASWNPIRVFPALRPVEIGIVEPFGRILPSRRISSCRLRAPPALPIA